MEIRLIVLAEVGVFTAATGLKETSLGSLALKDSLFGARLRRGGGVSLRSLERLRAFMTAETARRLAAAKVGRRTA